MKLCSVCGWYRKTGCRGCDVQNPPMPQSVADRQRAFKESMKEAGFVRLEAYVTKEQREKFRRLGGDEWLRKKIEQAKKRDDGK